MDERLENVTAKVKAGRSLARRALIWSPAQVRAGNSPWHGNRCYVNLLSPGVTEKFLEVTLEPYRKDIGEQFGKRVPGVFTDEPNIRPAGDFPWSEVLAEEFQKRWGYDLLDHLPSLSQPVGDWRKSPAQLFPGAARAIRRALGQALPRLLRDEQPAVDRPLLGPRMAQLRRACPTTWRCMPGISGPPIDCLMNQYAEHTHAQFGNVRMVKELSSVANQLGRKRTLCEIYGAGGWDLRFEDMKRIGDWLEVLGVNTLNQHLSYVTIRGARKRDHPQSFSYHEPWWEAYHVSAEYFARLSAALLRASRSTACWCSNRPPPPGCTRATERNWASSARLSSTC